MTNEQLDKKIEERKLKAPPVPADKGDFEAIKVWLTDTTDTLQLTPEQQVKFDCWKHMHFLRVEGMSIEQMISRIKKIYNISERTIKRYIPLYTKLFRYDFDADYELYLLLLKIDNYINRAEAIGDFKTVEKFTTKKIKLLEFFKGDGSLPNPELFSNITINITANPEDIGLEKPTQSVDQLLKQFLDKRTKIEEAEIIELEDE